MVLQMLEKLKTESSSCCRKCCPRQGDEVLLGRWGQARWSRSLLPLDGKSNSRPISGSVNALTGELHWPGIHFLLSIEYKNDLSSQKDTLAF